jgi:hypothetical protein
MQVRALRIIGNLISREEAVEILLDRGYRILALATDGKTRNTTRDRKKHRRPQKGDVKRRRFVRRARTGSQERDQGESASHCCTREQKSRPREPAIPSPHAQPPKTLSDRDQLAVSQVANLGDRRTACRHDWRPVPLLVRSHFSDSDSGTTPARTASTKTVFPQLVHTTGNDKAIHPVTLSPRGALPGTPTDQFFARQYGHSGAGSPHLSLSHSSAVCHCCSSSDVRVSGGRTGFRDLS